MQSGRIDVVQDLQQGRAALPEEGSLLGPTVDGEKVLNQGVLDKPKLLHRTPRVPDLRARRGKLGEEVGATCQDAFEDCSLGQLP